MGNWMKKTALAAVLAGMTVAAVAAGPWAAKVNGVEISAQEVEDFNAAVEEQRGFKLKPSVAADQLINRELLAQEAIRQGKDKNLDKIELARQVFKEFGDANTLSETDVRKEYDSLTAGMPKKTEYRLRGIVVESEAQAQSIIAGLDAGQPFSSFVSQSIDPHSKKDGGEMGWFIMSDIDRAYQIALQNLKPGSYHKKPVVTSAGYSVVKLEELREVGLPEYSKVREDLINKLNEARREKLMKPLRDSANIERSPDYESVKDRRDRLNLNK